MTELHLPVVNAEPPTCFGVEWDRNEVACAGGPDPAYTDAKGNHVRATCSFFSSCGARTFAAKGAQALIPTQSLARPAVAPPAAPPPAPQPNFQAWLTEQAEKQKQAEYYAQQQRQIEAARNATTVPIRPQMAPSMFTPPHSPQQVAISQQAPVAHPANLYQLNYEMPGYLTHPEPRAPGEGLSRVLFRELIRAAFKALGHAFAHFFDSRPWKDTR